MKVKFWGTRGSLPATVNAEFVRAKVLYALEQALKQNLTNTAHILDFVDKLPFWSRATYGTNTACVELIDSQSDIILLDAGTGIRDFAVHFGTTAAAQKPATFHIFLSHLHWDHIIGFPFFTPAFNPNNTIIIHTFHPEAESAFRKMMAEPCFPVSFDMLKAKIEFRVHAKVEPFHCNNFVITPKLQNHPGNSYGYRFEKDHKAFVYSTDCEHPKDIVHENYEYKAFFKSADVLIFDGQYSQAEATFLKENWGHSSNIIGVELAAHAEVKHLVVFHLEPTASDKQLDHFFEDTVRYCEIYQKNESLRSFPSKVSLAYDGLELEF